LKVTKQFTSSAYILPERDQT